MPSIFPNLPDQVFADGSDWTPELAYRAFYFPRHVPNPQYLGELPLITDAELSNATGSLQNRFNLLDAGFRVTANTGLNVNVAGGTSIGATGTAVTFAGTVLSVPASSTSFVWLNGDGTVAAGLTPPVVRVLLAQVTTTASIVATITDLRNPGFPRVAPVAASIRSLGGSSQVDKVCTNGESFNEGVYYFRDFTVPPGITINIGSYARFVCSGRVTIAGVVIVSTAASGGGGFGASILGSLTVGGVSGAGIGAGSASGGGTTYNYEAQPYGSGGATGFVFTNSSIASATISSGGRGGGGVRFEAAGTLTVTGTITANGTNAITGTAGSGNTIASGGGGGSGGFCYLASLVGVTLSGTINLRGGAGGTAHSSGSNATYGAGGGGGGGGVLVLASPNNNTTGSTVNLQGGNVGLTPQTPTGLGGGVGGGFGGAGGVGTAGAVGTQINLNLVPVG